MHDSLDMAVLQSAQQLPSIRLLICDQLKRESGERRAYLDELQGRQVVDGVEVALQVPVHVLEHKV